MNGATQITSPPPVSGNVFLTCYTSIIMILLTLIIAFFFRPDVFSRKAVEQESEYKISTLEISKPFEEDGVTLSQQEWSGIIFALKNHDLNAEIIAKAATSEEAIAHGMTIFRSLLNEQIPASAIRAYGVEDSNSKGVSVRLYEIP